MPSPGRIAALLLAASALAAAPARTGGPAGPRAPALTYHADGSAAGSWSDLLSALGLQEVPLEEADILITGSGEPPPDLETRVRSGLLAVVEAGSPAARGFGFVPTEKRITVQSLRDERAPELRIVWEHEQEVPVYRLPDGARVFARDRWTGAPLAAGLRLGAGAVLWTAVSPGKGGYERFPYLLQALADLGLEAPFRSQRLWAFLDGAYRLRVDLDYFARRWRRAGISAVQAAAWHYFEGDEQRDAWLQRLIRACHRQGIQVYAWLELPHVSERFWQEHPEWREKTAAGQDAHLDWRKLMNLLNPDCARAVAAGIERLILNFDWDGVNLAELYFESLEGAADPARFTPMNADVRAEFQRLHGFDPAGLFQPGVKPAPAKLRLFLDYRADLAARLQEEWIARIERLRNKRPHLGLVLTQVDDRYDAGMRDLIGADSARALALLDKHDFVFLVEDPATVWSHGPERYPEIARRYRPLTSRHGRLAIDINVVERYQDVYPTKQQTGGEMLRQVHLASLAFPRVALYAEHSLLKPDLALLPAAAAAVERAVRHGRALTVTSRWGAGVRWRGPARVNGKLWPVIGEGVVCLPPGTHTVEPAAEEPPLRILRLNADLVSAEASGESVEIAYEASARAYAVLERRPARLALDGFEEPVKGLETEEGFVVSLPRGQHLAVFYAEDRGGSLLSE